MNCTMYGHRLATTRLPLPLPVILLPTPTYSVTRTRIRLHVGSARTARRSRISLIGTRSDIPASGLTHARNVSASPARASELYNRSVQHTPHVSLALREKYPCLAAVWPHDTLSPSNGFDDTCVCRSCFVDSLLTSLPCPAGP